MSQSRILNYLFDGKHFFIGGKFYVVFLVRFLLAHAFYAYFDDTSLYYRLVIFYLSFNFMKTRNLKFVGCKRYHLKDETVSSIKSNKFNCQLRFKDKNQQ